MRSPPRPTTILEEPIIFYLKTLKREIFSEHFKNKPISYWEGSCISGQNEFEYIEVQSEQLYLQIDNNYGISQTHWIPIDTPNYKSNMDPIEVENFFKISNLPENILPLI